MNNKPIRVAQIMGKWVGGGVEAVIMNYYRNIDRNKIQFDFICDSDSTNIPYEEIEQLGGRVILCPPYQKIFKYIKELKRIFKENNYNIVHSNLNALSVFPLYAAKKAGIKVRIAHSHSTSNKKEWKKNILKNILRPFSKKYSNVYFACTEHAARWLFGNKTVDKGLVTVINNGINLNNYIFNEEMRKEKRKELKYQDSDIVIGHIGRFMSQKNHTFIVDIFNELHKKNNNYKLMLIGQGPLKEEITEKVNNLGLNDYVAFLGQKEDAYNYYQAMDLFLFPSLYEGLGMVFVEAQVSGLTAIASTDVPVIAQVSDKAYFISLEEPLEIWVNKIEENINNNRIIDLSKVKELGYDIVTEVCKLENKYIDMLRQ